MEFKDFSLKTMLSSTLTKTERYSEEFFLENLELETDFTKNLKAYQPICAEKFPVLHEKDHNNRLIDFYLQCQQRTYRVRQGIRLPVFRYYR